MRRLPGIRIVDVPPPPGDGLPAMDVPVFVGFAERGPLHRPVALEGPAQYAAVFGGPLELPVSAGSPLYAHLPAAVAAFFAGGGRRCYVVRVAAAHADSPRFAVAGLRLAMRPRAHTLPGPWILAGEDFTLRANSPGTWADAYELAVRRVSAPLRAGARVRRGQLLRARPALPAQGLAPPTGWLRAEAEGLVDSLLAQAPAEAWLWTGAAGEPLDAEAAAAALGTPAAPRPDPAQWLVERITVDLALRHPSLPPLRREDCALAAGGGELPWFEADVLARFDGAQAATPARGGADPGGLTSLSWPLAGPAAEELARLSHAAGASSPPDPAGSDWMLVPVGVEGRFEAWSPARPADPDADALARMGLDDYGPALFLDPAWHEGLRGAQFLRWAEALRFLTPAPRRLCGLHAALGHDDAAARDATWIAVPDAVHPGWTLGSVPPRGDGLIVLPADPACTCGADRPAFGLCEPPPRAPQPPRITLGGTAGSDTDGVSVPADVECWLDVLADPMPAPPDAVELQIARRPDFADARPVGAPAAVPAGDMAPQAFLLPARYCLRLTVGGHFLRARAWRGGLPGGWSVPLAVHAVAAVRVARAGPPDGATLLPVHMALMDLCAATREHFGLLSVPREWGAEDLATHVAGLRAHAAGGVLADQADSFVALHHPWLQRREGARLVAHPPEGAVLGTYARRSRRQGAWSCAGLDALAEASALSTPLSAEAIEAAGANALELRARGIAATRASTLSEDPDWSAVGVRRLFILLRRLARREGERFSFEPNDLSLRRSLERSFDGLLGRLMQRGAFRGDVAPDCYQVRAASGVAALREIEEGCCSLEIRVAPSRPLRFLTLRVLRAGEQLQMEEG